MVPLFHPLFQRESHQLSRDDLMSMFSFSNFFPVNREHLHASSQLFPIHTDDLNLSSLLCSTAWAVLYFLPLNICMWLDITDHFPGGLLTNYIRNPLVVLSPVCKLELLRELWSNKINKPQVATLHHKSAISESLWMESRQCYVLQLLDFQLALRSTTLCYLWASSWIY